MLRAALLAVRDISMRSILTKLVSAIVIVAALTGAAFAQKSKSTLSTEITQQFPNNSTGAITPAILRNVTTDFVNSWQQYPGTNKQTGTTYTFQASDYGAFVSFNNASSTAVTLPTPGTAILNSWNVFATNIGAGVVTITPSGTTINGLSSVQLAQNEAVWIVTDGSSYTAICYQFCSAINNLYQLQTQPNLVLNFARGNSGIVGMFDYSATETSARRWLFYNVIRASGATNAAQMIDGIMEFQSGSGTARQIDLSWTGDNGACSGANTCTGGTNPWQINLTQNVALNGGDTNGSPVQIHMQSQANPGIGNDGQNVNLFNLNPSVRNVNPPTGNSDTDAPINIATRVAGMQNSEFDCVRASAWNDNDDADADNCTYVQYGPRGGGEAYALVRLSPRDNSQAWSGILGTGASGTNTVVLPNETTFSQTNDDWFGDGRHWLVIDKQIAASPEYPPSEKTPSSDFSSGWTPGAGWSVSGGAANGSATSASITATAVAGVLPNAVPVGLVSGNTYSVTFTVSVNAGSVAVSLGGGTAGSSRSTNGTFTQNIVAGATQTIAVTGTAFTGSVSNITVQLNGQTIYPISSYDHTTRTLTLGVNLPITVTGLRGDIIGPYNAGSNRSVIWQSYGAMSPLSGMTINNQSSHSEKNPDISFQSPSSWTAGAGWTVTTGVATAVLASSNATITAYNNSAVINSGLISGRQYVVSWDVATATAGTVAVQLGGGTAGTAHGGSGFYFDTVTAGASQVIAIVGAGFSGTVTHLSITPLYPKGTGQLSEIVSNSQYNGFVFDYSNAKMTQNSIGVNQFVQLPILAPNSSPAGSGTFSGGHFDIYRPIGASTYLGIGSSDSTGVPAGFEIFGLNDAGNRVAYVQDVAVINTNTATHEVGYRRFRTMQDGSLVDVYDLHSDEFQPQTTDAIDLGDSSHTFRRIWISRNIYNTSGAPTPSSCGTTPAVTAGSSNSGGQFTTGTGTPSACTLTFANAYATTAFCTVTPANAAAVGTTVYVSSSLRTAFTVTLGAGTDSAAYNYSCTGN